VTRDEFEAIVFLFKGWKGGFDDDAEEAYWTFLQGYDKAQVLVALKRLTREGSEFVPSVPAIVQAMEQPALPFDEAWPSVRAAMARYDPFSGRDSVDLVLENVRRLVGAPVAGWLSVYGVERLAAEPVDDPSFGGAVLRRVRESYSEMTSRPEQRDRLVRQLGEARRGELGRVDAAGLLSAVSSVEFGAGVEG
jgi:hypothetical protein